MARQRQERPVSRLGRPCKGGEACLLGSGRRSSPRVPLWAWREREGTGRADLSAELSSRATALPTRPVEVVGARPSSSPSCLERPQEAVGQLRRRAEQEHHYPLLGPQVSRAGVGPGRPSVGGGRVPSLGPLERPAHMAPKHARQI